MKNYLNIYQADKFSHSHSPNSSQWFFQTSERALETAYGMAMKIKTIEDEYFGGKKVSAEFNIYSQNVIRLFKGDVNKYLTLIKIRIAEFNISYFLLRKCNYDRYIDRLNFIDEILQKYKKIDIEDSTNELQSILSIANQPHNQTSPSILPANNIDSPSLKTGAFPRSIGRTLNKIKTDLSPNSETQVIKNFQNSRRTTRQAIRFILLLMVVPLLIQQLSKQIFLLPTVEHFRDETKVAIFLNSEMKEEAFKELHNFEEELKFENVLRMDGNISPEVMERKISEKAQEIANNFYHRSNEAISNIFADLLGLISFASVIVTNQKGVVAVNNFLNQIIYGLSDSAKAFIIILFTDIFVGFHSPHGWEVLLESLANHLGIVANHSAIFVFIATFPVILDTIMKYWIFRYLNQISPSAVATLKNMNE